MLVKLQTDRNIEGDEGLARYVEDEVKDALRRIREEQYGVCARCGGEIPRERLEVLPHAKFCVPCLQRAA